LTTDDTPTTLRSRPANSDRTTVVVVGDEDADAHRRRLIG
jgi:hypothetical protein